MGSSVVALEIRDKDVQALVGSKFYKPLKNGIQFAVDKSGKLVDIPKADIDGLIGSIVNFDQAGNWWVGDTGCVVLTQWGEDALTEFCDKIGKDPVLVKKYMSVSRAYGWPNQITELRHPDTENVTHRHHQLAQGIKNKAQRMRLLDTVSKKKLTTADFHELIQNLDGKGKPDEGPGTPERGVFKIAVGIWDEKVESAEQFLQKAIDKLKEEFSYYRDPKLEAQRELNTAKEKLLKNIDPVVAEELKTAGEGMELEEFKTLVNDRKSDIASKEKITGYVERMIAIDASLSDETKATLQAKRDEIIAASTDFEDAKTRVKAYKDSVKDAEKAVNANERLAGKIKNEDKRKELLDLAAAQNLSVEQFTPIVEAALAEELIAAETERISKRASEKAAAMVAPKTKAAAAGVNTSGLAHPKKGRASKKGNKKR